jgi:NSS family neurotransmitter:Na+ symporter
MMLALLMIMVVLAVYSCTLEGGTEGLKFYLLPNVERFKKTGAINVIVAAMNQSFFSLSLGIGAMAIFGSYLGKDRRLMGEAVNGHSIHPRICHNNFHATRSRRVSLICSLRIRL